MPNKTAAKAKRVSLDTVKFVNCWVAFETFLFDPADRLMSNFIPELAKALELPTDVIKPASVRAKCYALNVRAKKRGLVAMPVPGSGLSSGSGLPVVDWDSVFKSWPEVPSKS